MNLGLGHKISGRILRVRSQTLKLEVAAAATSSEG